MRRSNYRFAAIMALLLLPPGGTALGQKSGRIMRVYHIDSPASMSIHEEATISAVIPMMGATCRQPHLKGLTIMVNSSFNGWRFEDVWLDK